MKQVFSLLVATSLLAFATPAQAGWFEFDKDRSVDKVVTVVVNDDNGCVKVDTLVLKDVLVQKRVKLGNTVWEIEKVKSVTVENGKRTADVVKTKVKTKRPK